MLQNTREKRSGTKEENNMPLVNAKCTNCGGTLQVDNAKEAAVCPFCGSAFIVEKAVQNYNIVNKIQANVVNVYGEQQKDFVIKSGVLTQYKGESVNVVIPDNVLEIAANVFANNRYLSSVTLPASLRRIGYQAFYYCDSLEEIVLPAGVRSIGERAFAYCKNLKKMSFPANLQSVGDFAFAFCDRLEALDLPASVQTVGDGAFSHCRALKEVTMDEGAEEIGMFAFYGCNALRKVTLPKTLKNISLAAFCSCPNLTDFWYAGSLNDLIRLCYDSDENAEENAEKTTEKITEAFYMCCPNTEEYLLQEDTSYREAEYDLDGFVCDATIKTPPLKNLYLEGNLMQGTIELPENYARNASFFSFFTFLKGYDKVDTVILPRKFNNKKRLSFCPVCGSYKTISLFGKCKRCGTKFIRKK